MLIAILLILIVLWVLGYIQIPGFFIPNIVLFTINGQDITLWNLLIFAVIVWAIGILPTPFRQIAGVILILWLLSTLGLLTIFAGLPSLLVIAVIIAVIVALFSGV
jgi:hypothetical protein